MKIKIWGVVYQIVNPGGFNKEEWFSPWVSTAVPSACSTTNITDGNFRSQLIQAERYILSSTQWFKITEKVSFNIASEASYVYILSGQKFTKNANLARASCITVTELRSFGLCI